MSAREIIAAGLHRSGALSVLERVARSYEFRLESNSRRPRWSRAASGKFVILCYHRVGTGGIPYYSELATAEFEKQMRFLRRHYRILSLEQLVREISDPNPNRKASPSPLTTAIAASTPKRFRFSPAIKFPQRST